MRTKRSREGYYSLDHGGGPGLTEQEARAGGLPLAAGRGVFEAPTITCRHCNRVVILNPNRTRERGYCPKCDAYLCDGCEVARRVTGECNPIAKQLDALEQAANQRVLTGGHDNE